LNPPWGWGLAVTAFTPERPSALCAAVHPASCSLDLVDDKVTSDATNVARTNPVFLSGWAADTSTATVPPVVVVELVGAKSFYAGAARVTERPDVAAATNQVPLLHSGYDVLVTFRMVDPGQYAVRIAQVSDAGEVLICDTRRALSVE
jgi:hypothetical protein